MIEVYNKADLLPEAGVPLPAPDPSPAPGAGPGSHPSSPEDLRQHSRASPSARSSSARQQHHSVAGAAAEDRSGSGDTLVGASAGAHMAGLHAGSAGAGAADEQLQEGAPRLQAHGAKMHEEVDALCASLAACAPDTTAAAGITACGGHAAEQAAVGAHEAGAGDCPSAEDACQNGSRGNAAGPHALPEGSGHDQAGAGVRAAALPRVYTSTVTRAGLYELLREIDRKARACFPACPFCNCDVAKAPISPAFVPDYSVIIMHAPNVLEACGMCGDVCLQGFLAGLELLYHSGIPVAGEGAVLAARPTSTPRELSCREDAAARGVGPCLCAFPACV